ncbi:UDP-N-acetylglucosamine 1-carboxyvinyltransferase [Proteiniclasticum ruminis]|uniref:UDP-N-acetylglucosamine 1-carboxyvinyltransferase n=1 Tax=Proteiniclasticum ruminis TaxID=398199 RepID=A0A1G8LCS2_9CLOT|nr:UDP-N-acetylglucosamine 1-carboxyvinyltransferase [Proteiniclasticum ruminis]SDI53471.1 UDP-N-acetylglucosamine 1-carboxyvinyltransferase [Proteiniclasticum ruminis]
MEKLIINGGAKLHGEVEISGAKNAAVAILPAAIMVGEGTSIIENIPDIDDVHCLERIIEAIGGKIEKNGTTYSVDCTAELKVIADTEDVRKMRASYYLVGALLGRYKSAKVELPGGCAIGVRPMDQHIKGFEALGAKVTMDHGSISVKAEKLIGANIFFDVVSVGATINVMLAATLAEGQTVLENVAREPHVVDVANFLNTMGADIKGAGTDVIRINGVEKLHGCTYSVIPDQIEAGTYMIATAACGGRVTIKNIIPKHMESISAKLEEMGVLVEELDDSLIITSDPEKLIACNIKTSPYPGFPTDVQQPMSVLMSIAKGRSIINESIWESRFKHMDELKKMGASVLVEGRTAIIEGVSKLSGANVRATDLRAGAAMVIAGLIADGKTEISDIEHIYRGYPDIEKKFKALGADIHVENN